MDDHLMNFVDEEKEKNYIIILQTFLESRYSLYNYVINQIKEIIIHSINYKRYICNENDCVDGSVSILFISIH